MQWNLRISGVFHNVHLLFRLVVRIGSACFQSSMIPGLETSEVVSCNSEYIAYLQWEDI